MKFLLDLLRPGRAAAAEPAADPAPAPSSAGSSTSLSGDDTLGRGMDLALTVLAFLIIGWLIDTWLGLFPLFTIGLVVFASIGTFVRMKYAYDARMERLEHERRARLAGRDRPHAAPGAQVEETA